MASLVPQAAATLDRDEDPIELMLREGTSPRLLAGVASGRMDLAVVSVPADPPEGLLLEELLHDPLLLAVPRGHPLAGASRVDPEALRDERWIAGSSDPGTTLLGAWIEGGWRPKIAFEVRDWTAKIGLVAGGCGVTIVPGLIAAALPVTISVVAIDHPRSVRTIALATREAEESTGTVDRVRGALKDALGLLPRSRR
jgi:DNA-binding transcriptional LysR family regulator